MNNLRYILERGSKKYACPGCGKLKKFVRYVDTQTGNYLPNEYGRCERIDHCGYHLNPYKDEYSKRIWEQERNIWQPTNEKKVFSERSYFSCFSCSSETVPVYFDFDTFKQTLEPGRYNKNVFIQNLLNNIKYPFEAAAVTKVIEVYRLGTVVNGYRSGAVTFPFIDVEGNVRAIQVKQFDSENHTLSTDFLHSILEKHYTQNNKPLSEWLESYRKQDKRITCLFGEHLLSKYPNNPVALVEAPKTAVYGTLYFGLPASEKKVFSGRSYFSCFSCLPETSGQLIWLAVYNKSSFSFDKLKVLKGRFVYVFPDLSKDGNTFKEWETKAKEFEIRLPGTRFIFSDLLERLASKTDKINGNDIADVLIRYNWREFRKQPVCQRDLPAGRYQVNDYWRWANLFASLEAAHVANNSKGVNSAIDDLYRVFGKDGDLPTDLMQQFAPGAYNAMLC